MSSSIKPPAFTVSPHHMEPLDIFLQSTDVADQNRQVLPRKKRRVTSSALGVSLDVALLDQLSQMALDLRTEDGT